MKSIIFLMACLVNITAYHTQTAQASQIKKHPKSKSYHTKKYLHKHAKGLKKHPKHLQGMRHVSFLHASDLIPGSMDLSGKVSLPENQGQCGACWDFSLSKALRSEYMLAGLDPGTLEFNYLLGNCGPGPKMYGCNGGDFIAAQSMENMAGPGLNELNPYQGVPKRCLHLPVKASAVKFAMLGEGNKGPTFKDLAYTIGVQNHMLSIDVAAGAGEWESYSDGIYNDCQGGAQDVDHMVNLVGYSCETSVGPNGNCVFDTEGRPLKNDGYLIVENNWGEHWGTEAGNGHAGYMKTRMYGEDGSKCNAVATDALFFEINTPKPPLPSPTPPAPSPSPKSCSGFLCGIFCWPWCSK